MFRKLILRLTAAFMILTVVLTNNVYGAIPAGPSISSSSAILVDSIRGQVLYKKNSSMKINTPIASKIMTMLLSIEQSKLDVKVTISKESTVTEGSLVNLEIGEKYTVEDLLYATLLASANDSANALAESIAGDTGKFVEAMNTKAKALNLKNTQFTNPSGLYDENQYTTAEDLAILIKVALDNPTFNIIFSTSARPWISGNDSTILINQNKLFWWGYEGVDGGSVGYGNKSLQSSVTTVTRQNQRLICLTLEAKEDLVFNDSIKLLDFGFEHFRKGLLINKGKVLKNVDVEGHDLALASMEDIYYTHPVGESFIKNIDFNIKKDLKLPIKRDMSLGTARYILEDGTAIDVNLYSTRDINPPRRVMDILKTRLLENRDVYFILVALCFLEILIMLYNLFKFIKKRIYR